MADQISGTNENVENQTSIDPWVAAFAALEPKGEEADTSGSVEGQSDVDGSDASTDNAAGKDEAIVNAGDGDSDAGADRGLDTPAGADAGEGREDFESVFDIEVTDESIRQYEEDLDKSLREQAINDVAQEFIKRGIRNQNGRLGATIDDTDICKRDNDGVPRFYNPETGREFTGDNPRRQAQEWVDDYNKELARVFNNTCAEYEQHLKEESAPQLAVMKFAPKYEKLDDIRKGMFDNAIEGYEITDSNGNVIGYSCDLDKTLALVDKQIEMIQNYAKAHAPQQQQQQQQPTGPALDMKTSSGAVNGGQVKIDSIAAAMEYLQDQQLEKLNK